ncbi:MAG TPA: transcriptional regulator [Acidimicrobiales bacterium]|nr:transcriptional regulator [Acidimicrobiales bacterium]
MSEDWNDPHYARRVGERLRSVRRQKGMSLQAVEATSSKEFKASVLGAYERGERSISVPRLQRLASIYNVPVDQLLPRDTGPEIIDLTSSAGERRASWSHNGTGKVVIDLTRLDVVDGAEREMLSRYLTSIQVQRQDFNGRVLTVREEDIRALARMFDLTAEGLRQRLDALGLCLHR